MSKRRPSYYAWFVPHRGETPADRKLLRQRLKEIGARFDVAIHYRRDIQAERAPLRHVFAAIARPQEISVEEFAELILELEVLDVQSTFFLQFPSEDTRLHRYHQLLLGWRGRIEGSILHRCRGEVRAARREQGAERTDRRHGSWPFKPRELEISFAFDLYRARLVLHRVGRSTAFAKIVDDCLAERPPPGLPSYLSPAFRKRALAAQQKN